MPIQPRIEEPSNPRPSLNVSAFQRSIGKEQCCQLPSRSANFRSIISAWFFFASEKKSSALMRAAPLEMQKESRSRRSRCDRRLQPASRERRKNTFGGGVFCGFLISRQKCRRHRARREEFRDRAASASAAAAGPTVYGSDRHAEPTSSMVDSG